MLLWSACDSALIVDLCEACYLLTAAVSLAQVDVVAVDDPEV